jgi:hypothetical protein
VFSNVINVVFALVDCTGDGVVFIDGTVQCYDATWIVLIFVVVLLILFPVAFLMALKFDKLSLEARAAACRSFKTDVYYWGALTLTFRLLMSLVQFEISADLLPQYVRFLSFEHVNCNALCPVAAASLPSSRHVFTGCGLLLLFDRAVQLAGKSPNSSHKTPNPNTSKS